MDGLGLPVNEICRSESVESCQKSGEAVQARGNQWEQNRDGLVKSCFVLMF